MRILYLITRADLGGAQVHLLDLLNGLQGVVDPVVGVGEEGYFADAVRELAIPCHLVPDLIQPIAPGRDVRALLGLARLIREAKPDLVHAHTSKAGFLGRGAARLAGVPSVFTAHSWCFADGTSWKWKVAGIPSEWLAGRWSSAIINVSEANRNLASHYWIANRDRLLMIHYGIADTPHRAAPGHSGTPTIAVVARFCPQKDQGLLLRALAGMRAPAHAIFVGDGPTRPALEAEARGLGIQDRVEFLGERLDVPRLLASAHIFALPTRWEGLPLSILEAMRAGLPVVASSVDGVPEEIVEETTGFLVPPGDVGSFRARLQQLLQSPALRQRMGEAGRRRYEAEFTLNAMLRRTYAVYQRVIRGAREAAALPSGYSSEIPVDL